MPPLHAELTSAQDCLADARKRYEAAEARNFELEEEPASAKGPPREADDAGDLGRMTTSTTRDNWPAEISSKRRRSSPLSRLMLLGCHDCRSKRPRETSVRSPGGIYGRVRPPLI